MMMLAMLSLVPIETHLEADFVVCLPSDLCGIPTHVKVFRKLSRFDQKSGLVVILQFEGLSLVINTQGGGLRRTSCYLLPPKKSWW
jgi:hypothetical protein